MNLEELQNRVAFLEKDREHLRLRIDNLYAISGELSMHRSPVKVYEVAKEVAAELLEVSEDIFDKPMTVFRWNEERGFKEKILNVKCLVYFYLNHYEGKGFPVSVIDRTVGCQTHNRISKWRRDVYSKNEYWRNMFLKLSVEVNRRIDESIKF